MDEIICLIIILASLYALHVVVYLKFGVKYQNKYQFPLQNQKLEDIAETVSDNFSVINFNIQNGNVESFFFGDNTKKPAILVAYGNKGLIDSNITFAKALVNIGCHVLLVEYPGYGRSSGVPTEKTLLDAFTQAFDFLNKKKEVSKIIVYGNSMGGCISANLLKNRTPDALILRSTFANFGDLICKRAFLPRRIVKNGFFNEKLIRSYSGKILIMHGINDTIAKFNNAIQLDKASNHPTFIQYKGDHESPTDEEVVEQTKLFLNNPIST